MSRYWKEFENNPTSHSVAHHLMTISELREEFGYARAIDVSKRLNITRGSASLTLKALRDRGLIEEDANRFLRLSEKGRNLARTIQARRDLLIHFFHEILGVSTDQAELDACKLEHLISVETSQALLRYLDSIGDSDATKITMNTPISISPEKDNDENN